MIQLTEKDLKYIIKESINKIMLTESMTDIAFHFTNYYGLKGILKTNEFHLANQKHHKQKPASKTKPYYFCVTRQKYGDTGYGHIKRDFLVRITLDGRLLNQRYKTIVYDYFSKNYKHTAREQEIRNNHGKLPYKQSKVENEERLLSENPVIPNASKYILRIDIFGKISNMILYYKDLLDKLGLSDKAYLYEYGKNYFKDRENFYLQNRKCIPFSSLPTFSEFMKQCILNKENIFKLFAYVGKFNNGYASVKLNNKMNWIDKDGNLLYGNFDNINGWFDEANNFNEGFAIVKLNDKYNFINTEGNIIYGDPNNTDTWFDYAYDFNEGFGKVYLNKWNFIDTKGNILSDTWFNNIYDFKNNWALVEKNKQYYYINTKGILFSLTDYVKIRLNNGESIKDIFNKIYKFNDGYARVRLNNKWNYIDINNNIISNIWFDSIFSFYDSFAKVRLNNKWNFIDINGNILYGDSNDTNTWFNEVSKFNEGFAAVVLNYKYNFINTKGNFLSNTWFDNSKNFKDGFAEVQLNNKWYYIDTKGNLYDENKNPIKL